MLSCDLTALQLAEVCVCFVYYFVAYKHALSSRELSLQPWVKLQDVVNLHQLINRFILQPSIMCDPTFGAQEHWLTLPSSPLCSSESRSKVNKHR